MANEYRFAVGTVVVLDDTSRPSGNHLRIHLGKDGKWLMAASFCRPEVPKKAKLPSIESTREADRLAERNVEEALAKLRKK